jgi:hypothetical protein
MESNNAISHQDRYINFIQKWLKDSPDARAWLAAYGIYTHAIDDIIDGDKTDNQHILKTFELAAKLYMHPFCRAHHYILYSLIIMASNTYMDSVLLERSAEIWKQKVADALRQCGNEIMLACVEIVGGVEARREASLELREISYWTHHKEDLTPC